MIHLISQQNDEVNDIPSYWSIIGLQSCASFCSTIKESAIYIHLLPLGSPPHPVPHLTHLGHLRALIYKNLSAINIFVGVLAGKMMSTQNS